MEKEMSMLRVPQLKYWAVMVLAVFFSFICTERHRIDPSATTINFMHLFNFAANYGAQLWVTFVAGLTMYFSLPRCMFGQVQSRLFPMFFMWSLVTSAFTLATYIMQHPDPSKWDNHQIAEVFMQSISLIAMSINSIFLAPLTVSYMIEKIRIEKEAGVADIVGYADLTELKKNPNFRRFHRKFRLCHSALAMCNLSSMVANTLHLYNLSQVCLTL